MATTVSAYFQPVCRSHLAQPARCLDQEYSYSYSELPGDSVQSRRRQLIERCSEWRGARGAAEPQPRDPPPPPQEVSVTRARDELARAAQGSVRARRLNVDSGWSKVEEVRKKFEGAATVSFSRSFESPPRRRLADSLFASFKLPRRKEPAGAMTTQPRSLAHPRQEIKRKSAVELLAETKAFYVKSETVLDRKQELPLRVCSGLGQAIAAGGCVPVSSTAVNSPVCCQPYVGASPARTHGALGAARRAVSAGEGLQSTLRRLLEHSDSRENVYWPPVYAVPAHKSFPSRDECRRTRDCVDSAPRSNHNSGTFSGTSSSGTSGSKHRVRSDCGDARVFFPEQAQRSLDQEFVHAYSIPSSFSSPEHVELPEPVPPVEGAELLAEEVGAISPPAQYAHSTQSRYIRSNSQSAATVRRGSCEETECNNINSHKSLPDLHTHARCYNDNVSTSGAETMGRSPRRRRHSAHQRTASCSSKGTRSNHSSLVSSCEAFSEHPSPGEDNSYSYNRCGSSFARDSGGSSGHYTQRSAPPLAQARVATQQAHRTDSGSSGQHSHNRSYYAEVGYGDGAGLPEWTVSAPLQFQDGAPSPPPPRALSPPCTHYPNTLVGIHFQASAPPPQFQDETSTLYDNYGEMDIRTYTNTPTKCHTSGRGREYARYPEQSPEERLPSKTVIYAEPRVARPSVDDSGEYVNTTQLHAEEVTSPLGTFKRQRCLRYKQRRPRPILRSKSDISDSRYRRCEGRSPASAPGDDDSPESPEETSARLNRFFQTLGLDERTLDSILTASPAHTDSPVFFSDVSTVDSNQLLIGTDYTLLGPPQPKPIYRNTEPPSVVERNARIIKWLCNCRKMQLAQ